MFFIPYSTETLITRWPFGNLAIIAVCIVSFVLLLFDALPDSVVGMMVLSDWNLGGLLGHMFLHAGWFHLFSNMLFLWVFGNAVCEKIGNLAFVAVFLTAGVASGALHMLVDGRSVVGASGAINGIIGFYLMLYPINYINCFYCLFVFRAGTFQIAGFWLILFWFVVDAWHAFSGAEGGVAYWAHMGGFSVGLGLGILFLRRGWARMGIYDHLTLLDYLFGKPEAQPQKGTVTRKPKTMSLERVKSPVLPPFRPPASRSAGAPAITPIRPRRLEPAVVAAAPREVEITCPHCSRTLEVPVEMVGKPFPCPACQGQICLDFE